MNVNLAEGIEIDVQTMMTGRGCIIGQSGSGKSFLMGVIAEELCRYRMPFCVIDTEGEYRALKSQFNVIVVGGESKDLSLDMDWTKIFEASIANEVPIVLDVSDVIDKKGLVFKALEALYQLENSARKPYLVLIEEADKFAPQVVGKGANIIEEISVRGRKRGIGLLIATQRPANISKNVLSQCSYGFIGKLTIENDLSAVKILFDSRDKLVAITKLGVGEFVPFGLDYDTNFRVKGRVVRHIGSTPGVEQYGQTDPKLSSILKELKGAVVRPVAKQQKRRSNTVQILAIPASFTMEQANAYAERVAKKRFLLFGDVTEVVSTVSREYLPLGLCTVRIPTRHRNEYLEYYALVSGKGELVTLDRDVRFFGKDELGGASGKDYRRYLA